MDTVWKELSHVVKYSETQSPNTVLLLMYEFSRPIPEESWKPLHPLTFLAHLKRRKVYHWFVPLAEPLETHAWFSPANLPTHNSITIPEEQHFWNEPFFLFAGETKILFPCSWKTYYIIADCLQPYLWLTYLQECSCDIRHLIDCIHTILAFNNVLNVVHAENPEASSSRNSDGTH